MSKNRTQSRSAIRERARKRRQRQRLNPMIGMVIGGLLLIAAAWYLFGGGGSAKASFEYTPQDVVYDQSMIVGHEMGGATLDSIPFLPKDGPQPKIVLLEDFHSFGVIGATDIVRHDFVIANQGNAPLTISRGYTTCGCTTAEFSATVIPPGKVTIVTMILDAGFHDVHGQTVRRGIIIENNDPKNPQVELWAQASVPNN